MKINFILNGEDVRVEADLQETLYQVLHEERRELPGVFCGRASCLRCLVTLDGRPVPSCLVPMFRVQGREVVTPEGLKATEDWTRFQAFLDYEGFRTCPQCTEIQMFHILSYLEPSTPVRYEDLVQLIGEVPCRCATQESLLRITLEFLKTREVLVGKRR